MNTSLSRRALGSASLAVLTLGLSAAASAASVVSAPTAATQGRAPTSGTLNISHADTNGTTFIDVGDTLTANYAFADEDGDIQDTTKTESVIRWLSDGAQSGTGKTYLIKASDVGKTITFEVVPWTDANITDPAFGITYNSVTHNGGGSGEITPTVDSDVTGVTISGLVAGRPQVASTLTADVVCSGTSGTTCGGLTYKWERQKDSGGWAVIGTNASTYTPNKDDQKYVIRVTVTRTSR